MENDMNTAAQLKQSERLKYALDAVAAMKSASSVLRLEKTANSNEPVLSVFEQFRIYRILKRNNQI
jgi:hypothetical protein